ncbi:RDD family protein [Mucilaginibacter sp. SMC90]|uniref:RDD family protein n=1 Tax=Mucilaginibacter sp. SMC90 TaxID=2929803 RepID=UPI001FB22D20|nr:RDD family protein [Mucilaginibacter sp. SMC90]UOE50168.1 RDD family protein [Mucilaginibacter sp. SMC90]
MQTITVHTTQNIDIDYEIAGLGERIVARIIDYAIFIAFYFIFIFLIVGKMPETALIICGIIMAVIFVFYDLACETLLNGQSVGKRIMKIRVISLNGSRPRFGQYLLRWLMRMVDFGITLNLGALLCALVTENGQRIGDVVAGTAMVKTHPRTKIDSLTFRPSDDDYEPAFKEVVELNDNDVRLIADVIHNYMKTYNAVVVYNMALKLKEHLKISALPPDMNDLQFLQAIVKDYSHVSAMSEPYQ